MGHNGLQFAFTEESRQMVLLQSLALMRRMKCFKLMSSSFEKPQNISIYCFIIRTQKIEWKTPDWQCKNLILEKPILLPDAEQRPLLDVT